MEEDPPLRLKGNLLGLDSSSMKVDKLDLNKYMNQKKSDFSNRNFSIGGQNQSNTQFGTLTNVVLQT